MLFALSWHKMVGESGRFSSRSSLTPRLSFPDRFPSLLDYQDSSESGDTDILSENEGIGTQIPSDKAKQLPVPVSVREGKSDDLEPLIVPDDVSGKFWFNFQF